MTSTEPAVSAQGIKPAPKHRLKAGCDNDNDSCDHDPALSPQIANVIPNGKAISSTSREDTDRLEGERDEPKASRLWSFSTCGGQAVVEVPLLYKEALEEACLGVLSSARVAATFCRLPPPGVASPIYVADDVSVTSHHRVAATWFRLLTRVFPLQSEVSLY
ncbi:hypothetical protein MRX96_044019 [Rhipicephalus microplus]